MLRVNQSLVLTTCCAAIGCAALGLALTIDRHVKGWAFAMPGTTDATMAPATFPAMILSLIAVLAFATALTGVLELARKPKIDGLHLPRLLAILGTVLAGFASLSVLGFIFTSACLIVAVPLMLGYRNYPAIGLTAFLIAGVAWALFRYGMNVILPPFTLF